MVDLYWARSLIKRDIQQTDSPTCNSSRGEINKYLITNAYRSTLNNTFSAAVSNSTVNLYQLPHILNKETSLQLYQHWFFLQ